jgi:hypothetical protein
MTTVLETRVCINLHILTLKEGGSMFLSNNGFYPRNYTVSQLRRPRGKIIRRNFLELSPRGLGVVPHLL